MSRKKRIEPPGSKVQARPRGPATKVLFFGDMAATGFGTVTLDLGRRLIDLGLDIRFVSMNEVGDLPEPFNSRTLSALSIDSTIDDPAWLGHLLEGRSLYPLTNGQPWDLWKPEAAIMLSDYTAARLFVGQHVEEFGRLPTFHYCPIEGVDLPPSWAEMWKVIHPVAMSSFGADEIEKVVGHPVPMIYHGVDTSVFRPATPKEPITLHRAAKMAEGPNEDVKLTSVAECRSLWWTYFGAPKLPRVWLLRTDRHMPRKRYNAMIRAVTPVLYRREGTLLILHCQPNDQGGYLPDTISKLPGVRFLDFPTSLPYERRPMLYALFGRDYPQVVITMANGMNRESLVSLYNAADIYLSTSAEGFGLTVAEAMACGTPAVGVGYSAVPEVIGSAGIVVGGGRTYDNEYDHKWWEIDEVAYGQAVESLVVREARRAQLAKLAAPHIRASFSWETAARGFRDMIQVAVSQEAIPVEHADHPGSGSGLPRDQEHGLDLDGSVQLRADWVEPERGDGLPSAPDATPDGMAGLERVQDLLDGGAGLPDDPRPAAGELGDPSGGDAGTERELLAAP